MNKLDCRQVNNLIYKIARKDKEGLEGIYNLLGGRMLFVAKRYFKDKTLAEDALSESFLKIVKYASKFKGGNGVGWIMKIVRNTCLDMLKKEGVYINEFDENIFPDGISEDGGGRLAVTMAMEKLEREERYAIYCKYFLDMTVREIASQTGISKSAVSRLIIKAETKLKEFLK